MKTRRWVIGILALCVIAGGSFAVSTAIYSRQASARAQSAACGESALVTGYLQLTPEQEKLAAPINQSFREAQHTACAEMQEARTKLLSVLKRPDPTREEIDAALADLEQKQAELQRRAAEYLLELKSVLTEDQQKRLFDLVGQRFCEQGRCGGGICPGIGSRGCGTRPGWMR